MKKKLFFLVVKKTNIMIDCPSKPVYHYEYYSQITPIGLTKSLLMAGKAQNVLG